MEFLENYYSKNFRSFEGWFDLVKKGEEVYPRHRIPYHEWLNQYVDDINGKTESEVKELLRYLLFPFTRRTDQSDYNEFASFAKNSEMLDECYDNLKEYYKKISNVEKYQRLGNGQDAWEGLTWVLQLLPFHPYKAIRCLNLYLEAELGYTPDDRIIGIGQCLQIIEAKFIYTNSELERDILNLKPREFEWLIEILYKDMGYETKLTPATRDGGKDIIAYTKREDGSEKVYVECKLYKTTKLAKSTVEAFGFNIRKDNINRGVLFCTGYVNENIKNMDDRVQIWTLEEIIILLNAHIGADWNKRLNILLDNQRRKYKK